MSGQWLVWAGMPSTWDGRRTVLAPPVVTGAVIVLVATFACGGVALVVWRLARPLLSGRPPTYELVVLLGASLAAVPAVLVLTRVDRTPFGPRALLTLWVVGALGYAVAIGAALLTGNLLVRYRRADVDRRAEEARAAQAVATLEADEVRVRREVADRLNGTIQNRLVIAAGALAHLAADLAASGDEQRAAELSRWADDLDDLREQDVRTVSHALFPTGANIGTFDAIRLLLARLPPSIATSVDVRPGLQAISTRDGAPVPVPTRLALVYAVEEAVTNALKHGAAAVQVTADATPGEDPRDRVLHLTLDDDGTGLEQPDPPLHGLARHRDRIRAHGGTLTLEPGERGGTRLHIPPPV